MHMVMEGRATERVQLLQTDSSSDSSIAEEPALSDSIIPLAARTSEGLAYLAKVINEVRLRQCWELGYPVAAAQTAGLENSIGLSFPIQYGAQQCRSPQTCFCLSSMC